MGIHAEIVTETVREKGGTGSSLKDLIGVTLEHSDLEQAIDGDFVGSDMYIFPLNVSLEHGNALLLHFQNNVVNLP